MLPKIFIFRHHTVFTGKNQRLPTGKQRFPVGKQRLPFFEFKFEFRPVLNGYRSLLVSLPIPPKAENRLTVGKSNPGRARNQPTETGDCLVAWATEVGWVGLDFVRGGNPRFKSASPAGGRVGSNVMGPRVDWRVAPLGTVRVPAPGSAPLARPGQEYFGRISC